ncbi:MAG: serine/threonine-protein kinase, partial [Myxococcota bacterium]
MSTGRSLAHLVDQVLDGRYRIVRLLAEGGMSAVYEAEQLQVERRVAIKVLRPEISENPEMLARFRSEARIISELRHPNTLKLFDYGNTEDGMLYLVTELLAGEPLSLRLKRGPLSPKETLHVLVEVLRSLQEAHGHGVIHRDLKPGNLFLEEVAGETVVKVLDFGIAKMKAKRSEDPEQPTTADGMLLGTP